jgi:hypothetical protein
MRKTVKTPGTSWGSVFGGWLAALGALTITFPIAAAFSLMAPAAQARVDDPTIALPLVLALFVSWIAGGWVAGRMAGYRRSWHGLMSAIWGLFVALVAGLVAGGNADALANAGATLRGLDLTAFENATVFGAILGFVAVIFGGWLGGLLAPSPAVAEVARERGPDVERHIPARERTVVVARPGPVVDRRVDRTEEPTFWERLTAHDRELEAARRGETNVPPAAETRPAGEARTEDAEIRR